MHGLQGIGIVVKGTGIKHLNIAAGKDLPQKKVKISMKLLSGLVYPLFAANIHRSDKGFFCTERCNSCGICVKVCPAGNIVLNENGQPEWQHRCEQCQACFHCCPQQAVQFNKKTAGRNQYINPEVELKELFV